MALRGRNVEASVDFVNRVLRHPAAWQRDSRWSNVTMNDSPEGRFVPAAQCVVALAERAGSPFARMRFTFAPASGSFVSVVEVAGTLETVVYQPRSRQVFTTSAWVGTPRLGVALAAELLLRGRAPFADAYLALLDGLDAGLPQTELNTLLVSATNALVMTLAARTPIDPASFGWFHADAVADIPGVDDPKGIDLLDFVRSSTALRTYLAGGPTPFDAVRNALAPTSRMADLDVDGPTAVALEAAIKDIKESFELAMRGAGIDAAAIGEVLGTVEDAVVNNFDEILAHFPTERTDIIVSGNPIDGFGFHGPFDGSEAAIEWAARELRDTPWWTATLAAPEADDAAASV